MNNAIRPICFVIMPFRVKATGVKEGEGPAEVDFDRLWEKALRPAITALNYEAVRADEDLGALIIKDMLERLALSDLVIADLTLMNGNVYYEIGVRHGAKENGCVLISAKWSKQLFDVDQMQQARYPLPQKTISEADADEIAKVLKDAIPKLSQAQTPLYQIGYPQFSQGRGQTFRDLIGRLSKFQAETAAARAADGQDKKKRVEDLLATYGTARPILAPVAIELLYLVRDNLSFGDAVTYIDSLPEEILKLPLVQEQRALAQSGMGDHLTAIGGLETLITYSGDSSERQGLLGGRYKRLAKAARENKNQRLSEQYLDKAIEHYDRGMHLDLNDYYPASNLPVLLRMRNGPGDVERAQAINNLVVIACEAAIMRKADTEWTRSSLLTAAFDAGDAAKAEELALRIRRETPVRWKLDATLDTLIASVRLVEDAVIKARLQKVIDQLRALTEPTLAGG